MKPILRRPKLGGRLAIVNGLALVALFVLIHMRGEQANERAVAWIGFVLSLPIAWFFVLPRPDYQPTVEGMVFICIIMGLNSLVWGYGLAWLCHAFYRHLPRRGTDPKL